MTLEVEPKLVWCDPPAKGKRGPSKTSGPWDAMIADLRAKPGEWARICVGDQLKVAQARGIFRRAGCEVTTRKIDDTTLAVWARYVEQVSPGVPTPSTDGDSDEERSGDNAGVVPGDVGTIDEDGWEEDQ